MQKLQLKRPLVFLDFETTGLSIEEARIIEIALLKLHPQGMEEEFHTRVNPGIPIPPDTTLIHGITDADVRDAPSFADIAFRVLNFIAGSDIAGYNSTKFDIPLLAEELHRVNYDFIASDYQYVDMMAIHRIMNPFTLSAVYERYCGKEMQNAHSALADVKASQEILLAQLNTYPTLPSTVEELAQFCTKHNGPDLAGRFHYNEKGEVILGFGKYKSKTFDWVYENNPGYFTWMLKGTFPVLTKRFIEQQLKLRRERTL